MNAFSTRRFTARAAKADKRHAAAARDRNTISIILTLMLSVSLSGTLVYEVTRVPADDGDAMVSRIA